MKALLLILNAVFRLQINFVNSQHTQIQRFTLWSKSRFQTMGVNISDIQTQIYTNLGLKLYLTHNKNF